MKRRRATQLATQAVWPLIRTITAFSDLPKGFWSDSYVLGFISGSIIIFAKLSYGGELESDDLGTVIISVLMQLNATEAADIAERIMLLQQCNDPDYRSGFLNADKTIAVTYGASEFDRDPDVMAARELSKKMKDLESTTLISNAELGGALQHLLFHEIVRNRLRQ